MRKIWDAWKIFEFIKDNKGKLSSKRLMAYAAFISGLIAVFMETSIGGMLPAQVGAMLMAVSYFIQRLATLESNDGGNLEDTVKELLDQLKSKK